MGQVRATEVDGVHTFWVDSGRPTLAATLFFRAGMADETLTSCGWLHLLEHLALHGLPRGTLAVNGSVGILVTSFSVHGPADQVVEALATVSRRLAEPDLHELVRERGVLAAEAATRGGPAPRALGMRYGAQGPGLSAHDDAGLGRATPEALVELAARAFTTGNAALALDGSPPAGLELHLPAGDLWPEPGTVPVEEPRACYPDPAGLVLSGVVTRSATHTFLPAVLEDALRRKFRDSDGAAYAPYSHYEPVDADHAVVLAGTDVSPVTAPSLLGNVVDLVDDLSRRGPDPDALADIKAAMRQAYSDPYNVGVLAHRAAVGSLMGTPAQQLDDLLAEHDAVTVDDLVPGLDELRTTLIVGAPPTTAPNTRLRVIEHPASLERARGARSVNWPADESRLLVTDDGVSVGAGQVVQHYPLADLAGYLTWDNGARRVTRRDGWGMTILPEVWNRGDQQVRLLDSLVPPELHLPQPDATAPDAGDHRVAAARRWWLGLRRWTGAVPPRVLTSAYLAVVAVLCVLAVAVWDYPQAVGPLLVGAVIGMVSGRGRD